MSLKNFIIAAFAACAFAGAIFIAARPETHTISYAMPSYTMPSYTMPMKTAGETARR
jgi:hypothetical protein